jgi:MOSC domain-containing protein YiiM
MGIATVEAVSVVHEIVDGYYHPTAIDKRPVSGPVRVEELGPEGDLHVDRSPGRGCCGLRVRRGGCGVLR